MCDCVQDHNGKFVSFCAIAQSTNCSVQFSLACSNEQVDSLYFNSLFLLNIFVGVYMKPDKLEEEVVRIIYIYNNDLLRAKISAHGKLR